jgi:excisionase family DNA binding protein
MSAETIPLRPTVVLGPERAAGRAEDAPATAVYTADQLAELLQVSRRAVERWCAAGRLPPGARLQLPGRTVRFSRAVIDQWICDGCPAPVRPRKGADRTPGTDARGKNGRK